MFNFVRWFAPKYLFSKGLPGVVNLITLISVVGIVVGTAAIVLVLSVFNGFYDLINLSYAKFDSDLKIVTKKGKYFSSKLNAIEKIKQLQSVRRVTPVLEGKAMLKYHDNQSVIVFKGVKQDYEKVTKIKELVKMGEYQIKGNQGEYFLNLGMGVAYYTVANIKDEISPMTLYSISDKHDLISDTEGALRSKSAFPSSIFSLQKDIDDRMVIGPLELAQDLFETDQISALEIQLKENQSIDQVKTQIQTLIGKDFQVLNRYEQHETLFKVMQNEKAIAFWILTLMLIIAACNIVGSLTMIVLQKRRDVGILLTMGASRALIQQIFIFTGISIGIYGVGSGLVLAGIIGYLQSTFGFIKLSGAESFIIDHYPLSMELMDFIYVGLTVMSLVLLASWYPARQASNANIMDSIRL